MYEFLGDTPILKVNGMNLERLRIAMHLSQAEKAAGYAIDKERNRFILFSYDDRKHMIPFPAPLTMGRCAEMAWDWLQTAEYPAEPDHDGDNKDGWLCYNEKWGGIEGFGRGAFLAVEPHWIMFGK